MPKIRTIAPATKPGGRADGAPRYGNGNVNRNTATGTMNQKRKSLTLRKLKIYKEINEMRKSFQLQLGCNWFLFTTIYLSLVFRLEKPHM